MDLEQQVKPETLYKHLNRYRQSESIHSRLYIAEKLARYHHVCLELRNQHVGRTPDHLVQGLKKSIWDGFLGVLFRLHEIVHEILFYGRKAANVTCYFEI